MECCGHTPGHQASPKLKRQKDPPSEPLERGPVDTWTPVPLGGLWTLPLKLLEIKFIF